MIHRFVLPTSWIVDQRSAGPLYYAATEIFMVTLGKYNAHSYISSEIYMVCAGHCINPAVYSAQYAHGLMICLKNGSDHAWYLNQCFFRSSINFQKSYGQKSGDLNTIWGRLLGRSQLSNPSYLPCCITNPFDDKTPSLSIYMCVCMCVCVFAFAIVYSLSWIVAEPTMNHVRIPIYSISWDFQIAFKI